MKRRDFLNSCAAVSTGWAASAVRPARANQRAFDANQRIHYSNLTPAGIGRAPDGPPPPGLDGDFYLGPAPLVPFNPKRFLGTYRYFWDYAGGVPTDCVKSRQQPIAELESAHRVATACHLANISLRTGKKIF